MSPSSSIAAQLSPPKTNLKCVSLESVSTMKADEADLYIFIVPGACALQREVAGQWIDVRTMYRGGMVVTSLTGPFRVRGTRLGEGAALIITESRAQELFEVLLERVEAMPVLQFEADAVIERLVNVLTVAGEVSAPCVRAPIVEAITQRLSVISRNQEPQRETRQSPLPAWRLRRVTDLVNDRLDTGISLADMANAAGLSPMHFAARFKLATGMRPHQYLLAKRIECAKSLLAETNVTIMDVAIAVGFQTQAHFSTVFKQHEKTTPRQWREFHAPRAHAARRILHRTGASARPRNAIDLQLAG